MTLPKFIITMDGYFRLGMVNQHKHLLKPGDQCIGGGYYHFDFVSNRIEGNNRMGKTRDLIKKIRDTKGTFHAKMGTVKDRNGMD